MWMATIVTTNNADLCCCNVQHSDLFLYTLCLASFYSILFRFDCSADDNVGDIEDHDNDSDNDNGDGRSMPYFILI